MSETLRILVCGASGRMGAAVARLAAEAADLEIVGGVGAEALDERAAAQIGYPAITNVEDAADALARAHAVIDFSAPAALARFLELHASALTGRALVVGTTGLDAQQHALLDGVAKAAPVLTASNFSVGVNLLLELVERAARVLPSERYDVEIVEAHHRRKADAPSGTALSLAEAVAAAREAELSAVRRDGRSGQTGARAAGEIGLHALRGGDVVGEHRVHFIGERERLELAHAASDRALFAEGALLAARWAAGRDPGRYTMRDVLFG